MNVIDLGPVGALASVDFRFRARIWEMTSTPSIIATNAKGSNCEYWVRDNLVLRITPRQNLDVNEYWLGDEDRLTHKAFNEGRFSGPCVRSRSTGWGAGYGRAVVLLRGGGRAAFFLGRAPAAVV